MNNLNFVTEENVMKNNAFNVPELLVSIITEKKKVNSRYSLRAFARDVGISQSQLTKIIHGKVKISACHCFLVGKYLKLENAELLELIMVGIREELKKDKVKLN